MLKCAYCHKRYKYESERKRHEESHSPHFQCKVCLKQFSFLSALRRHEKQHDRKNLVYCGCGKSFRDEGLLKRHINYAHKGTFDCEKCNASFSSELAVKTHMKIHKPETERKFRCSFDGCGKSFNFQHHLKHHVLTHTNSKQYYCDICKKGFIQFYHLKTHLNTHNPHSWLQCVESNCKKKFSTEYARKRHLLTHKVKSKAKKSGVSDNNTNISQTESKPMSGMVIDSNDTVLQKEVETQTTENIKEKQVHRELVEVTPIKFEEQVSESSVPYVTHCKTIIGECIVKAESDNNNCLCVLMSENTESQDDITPIVDQKEKTIKNNLLNCNPSPANCESCECASTCSVSNSRNKHSILNFFDSNENIEPHLEIGFNGAIKIKESFDIEFSNCHNRPEVNSNNEERYFPYNSCKAILGNCIVSGNGTIDEGCLCIKMKIEEQQVTSEEIEAIVPHPNDPKLLSAVIIDL